MLPMLVTRWTVGQRGCDMTRVHPESICGCLACGVEVTLLSRPSAGLLRVINTAHAARKRVSCQLLSSAFTASPKRVDLR
ncbi:hypothetical protein [Paracoccus alcaliphilus]|uniref:hypothetical protein n=1 Tax=Paracoccus alcaliphilus TaxID=34002 RepID=UPI001B8B4CE4|nr:hypothetical protein [Paracoccus alcaliphilus]